MRTSPSSRRSSAPSRCARTRRRSTSTPTPVRSRRAASSTGSMRRSRRKRRMAKPPNNGSRTGAYQMAEAEAWHRVASLSDLKEGEVIDARAGDAQVALCRIDGRVHALDDMCPHAFAQLSQGFVEGGEIE